MKQRAPTASANRVADRPNWLRRTLRDHGRALADAWTRLRRHWFGTLLTGLVIGITLALPAALDASIAGLDTAGQSWEDAYQASLFLKDTVTTAQGQQLATEIGHRRGVATSRYISRDQALAEFRSHSGYGEALDLLPENPLPAVIVVAPARSLPRADANALVDALAKLPEVETARLDQHWLDRLYTVLEFVQATVVVLAVLLALAVILVIGNTARLDVEHRREEILVLKHVGATDTFIRRPFLYIALAYGTIGSLSALILIYAALYALSEPLLALFNLNLSSSGIGGLPEQTFVLVLAAGPVLCVVTSYLTVSQQLLRLDPLHHR
jgi:cell division transport system permease protein